MIDPAEPRRSRWWVLFGLFLVGMLAWTVATPMMAAPDEGAHAVRAAGVARGQLNGPHRELIIKNWVMDVPEAYARTADALCFVTPAFAPTPVAPRDRTPRCVPSFRGSDRLVEALTYEFRGTPHLYGLFGVPSLVWPDRVSMYMMRVLNALACAAFLASACMSAIRRPRRRMAIVGVLAGATPMLWYLGGTFNPNGIEIAAAISLWATLLALAAHDSSESDRRLVHRAGLAAFAMVSIRGLGPAWVLAAVVLCAVLAEPGRIRSLIRLRAVRIWAALTTVSTAVTAAWILNAPLGDQMRHPAIGLGDAVAGLPTIGAQSVGVFGTDYIRLPLGLDIGWGLVVLVGIALGFAFGTVRQRVALAGAITASVMLPVTTDGFNFPYIGFPWQGRYGLPISVGIVVIAFGVTPTHTRILRGVGATAGGLLLVGQAGAFVAIGRHLGMGAPSGVNIFDYVTRPIWQPAMPAGVLLAIVVLVLAGIGTTLIAPLIRRPPTSGPERAPDASTRAPVAQPRTS